MNMLGALTVLGWIIVIGLAVAVVGSVIYWVRPKPTPEQLEEHQLAEAERRREREPPGMSPH
jgi:hypothetical protein